MLAFFSAALAVVLLSPLLASSGVFAHAVDFPYVVIGGDIWLLDKDDGRKLFLLPETYYARVDNLDESFYYVTFNGVGGKVNRNSVSSIGYHTDAAGTMQELRIDPKYSFFTEIKLKSTMDGNAEDIHVPVEGSLVFLGKYPSSDMWYYVRYNEVCGYIKAEFTTSPDITIPAFVPEEKPADAPPPSEEETPEDNNLVKILVITGLSVALIVLLILLFRPKKKGANKYYYEDSGE